MRRLVGIVVAVLAAAAPGAHAQAPPLPLGFEPNRGQVGEDFSFVGRTPEGAAFLGASGAVLKLGRGERVTLRPLGARADTRVSAAGRMPGVVNHIHGRDPRGWQIGLPMYRRVRQHGVYPGVDLAFHFRRGALEYDWILAPGARARTIDLRVEGGRRLRLSRRGDLLVRTAKGVLRQRRPVAYQRAGGRRRPVQVRFVLRGDRRVGFAVGRYDRRLPLVIDPVVTFSTYLGGSGPDGIHDVATDADGSVYVSGSTGSLDFPTKNAFDGGCGTDPQASCNSSIEPYYDTHVSDVFVAKLAPDGRSLVYATYIGGSSYETATIDVDGLGRAHLFGNTDSADFPTTAGSLKPQRGVCLGGCAAMYVARLSAAGGLDWATYLGDHYYDSARGIAAGGGGVYLTGSTSSPDFPLTPGALGPAGGPVEQPYGSYFVTKLDPSGSQILWSGALKSAVVGGIDVGADGEAVVAGSASKDFYVSPGAAQTACDPGRPPDAICGSDGFVIRVKADGSGVQYSTRLGGSSSDAISDVALDAAGRALVTGATYSKNFPKAKPLITGLTTGGFVSRLSADGGTVDYSGLVDEPPTEVAVASDGGAYLAGSTNAGDLDVVEAVQPEPGSKGCEADSSLCREAFAMRVSPAGDDLRWSTYVGGSGDDHLGGIAAQGTGVLLAGSTYSPDLPVTNAMDDAIGDGVCRYWWECVPDGFITRIDDGGGLRAPYDALADRRRLNAIRGSVHGRSRGSAVWFEWTAPANRMVAFDTRGSDFAATLTVQRGSPGNLTTVAGGAQRVAWRAVRGRTYRIALAAGSGNYTLQWDGAPPANDRFADAQTISGATGAAGGNTVYATGEAGEPDGPFEESIWYSWTAPQSGVVVFTTQGSDAPVGISVWRGRHVDVLESIAGGEPAYFEAVGGFTYRIRIAAGSRLGDVELRWRYPSPPPNDDLADAITITGTEGSLAGETYAATGELQEPANGGRSLWYRWTVPVDGIYSFDLDHPGWWGSITFYTGTGFGDLDEVARGGSDHIDPSIVIGLRAGTTYLIAISTERPFRLKWWHEPIPANDFFSAPLALEPAGGQIRIESQNATIEEGEPTQAGSDGTVWYSWTAPATGPVVFTLRDPSSWDRMRVFTGTLGALTEVPGTRTYTDAAAFNATAGTTYRLQMSGGHRLRLTWAFGAPANDAFAAAQALSGGAGTVTGTVANATAEAGEPTSYGATTWYSWTAPSTGTATFTTAGTEAGEYFEVFKGTTLSGLTWVAQAARGDDGFFSASFAVTAGTAYRIRTSASLGTAGTFRLSWNQPGGETVPPDVEMVAPEPGTLVRGGHSPVAWVSDRSGIAKVEFFVNGVKFSETGPVSNGRIGAYDWDTRTVPDGQAQLTARATDRFGNVATSAPLAVVVDNTAPVTTIAGAPSGTTASRTATLTIGAADQVKTILCRLDGGWWFECEGTLVLEHLEDGPHVLDARAWDVAGNGDVVPARVNWVVDGLEGDPEPEPTPSPEPTLTPDPEPEPSPEPTPEPDTGGGGRGSGETPGGGGDPPAGSGQFVPLPPGGATISNRSPDGALQLTASVTTGRLTARTLRRGLGVRIFCSVGCRATARLALSAGQARRARLRRGTIARGAKAVPTGESAWVRLRPSRRVAAALRKRRGLRVQLVVEAVTPAGSRATIRRTLVVR